MLSHSLQQFDAEVWQAVWQSPTFLPNLLPGFAATGTLVLLGWWICRMTSPRMLRALWQDQRGAATAMDLALVAPVFVFVMLLILQWAMLMKDTLIVHYAAFAAARSARVHLCPPPANGDMANMSVMGGMACDNDTSQPEMAARYALITASPFGPRSCDGGCSPPQDVVVALANGTGTQTNLRAWQDQAQYAFDGSNLEIQSELLPVSAKAGTPGESPARVRVRFRHILLPWMEWTFGNGRRGDGTAYTIIEAEVTVL